MRGDRRRQGKLALKFKQFCKDYHIPIAEEGHHHCHRGWIQTHCPRCSSGKEGWHLGYNIERAYFNCWRCGKLSDYDMIKLLLNRSNSQSYIILFKYRDGKAKGKTKTQPARQRARKVKMPAGLSVLHDKHIKYLRGRDFDPMQLAKDWKLEATQHLSADWNWRIIIPFYFHGELVTYQGRSIGEKVKPKYKNCETENSIRIPNEMLYGMDKIPGEAVIVVEGSLDVWRLGPGAVSITGIDWSIEQANLLRDFKRRYIMFDDEPLAQEKAEELAKWLSSFPGETEVITGLGSDPGDLSTEKAEKIIKELRIFSLEP